MCDLFQQLCALHVTAELQSAVLLHGVAWPCLAQSIVLQCKVDILIPC